MEGNKEDNLITIIDGIKHWNEFEEIFEDGSLKLKFQGYEFQNSSNGDVIKTTFFENAELQICYKDSIATIYDGNQYTFITDEVKYNEIIKHFDRRNQIILDKRLKFKEEIEINIQKYLNNNILKEYLVNFIKKTPIEIFLDINKLIALEYIVNFSDSIGKLTLLSTEQLRKNVVVQFQQDEQFYALMWNYRNNYFNMLIEVINKKITFNSEESCKYTVLSLLKIYSIKYYGELWNNMYGNYFEHINSNSIEEFIKAYLEIYNIEHEDEKNINMMIYYLLNRDIKIKDYGNNIIKIFEYIYKLILKEKENKNIDGFEKFLLQEDSKLQYSIEDVDLMNGYEFENFVGTLFKKIGYTTQVTKSSGDQGIDVIAEKNTQKIGIQAKCYSNKVSNSAIQEVVAGLKYYNCNKGIVVTNNYFTDSARELANINSIILWDRNVLKEKIEEILN